MKIKIITSTTREVFATTENAIAAGYVIVGTNTNPRQRDELQGAPKFKGLLGPMWDGDCLRYEDPKTYEELSQ